MEGTPDGTTEIIAVGTVDTRTAGAGTNMIGMIGMTVMSGETAMVATTVAAVTEAKRPDVFRKRSLRGLQALFLRPDEFLFLGKGEL